MALRYGCNIINFFTYAFVIDYRVPIIGGKDLDLHKLFIEVTSRGGIIKVCISNCSIVFTCYNLSLIYFALCYLH